MLNALEGPRVQRSQSPRLDHWNVQLMLTPRTEHLIDLALEEDVGSGDVTSHATIPRSHRSRAIIAARESLVVCGIDIVVAVFARVDRRLRAKAFVEDGTAVGPGRVVLEVRGPTIAILTAERTALNFLQRLSAVATAASRYVAALEGTGVRVADTRKTTPGWRALEKYAVRCGGGVNHRLSLGEHVLIKDNHIAAAGSLARAVRRCRAAASHLTRIEVEAKTMREVREACGAGADFVLLDNMSPAGVRAAIAAVAGRARVEVSGNIRLETIREYALPGVDVISVGALTHSAAAVDLSLDLRPVGRRR